MSLITNQSSRLRTVVKTYANTTVAANDADYLADENAQAGVDTATYSMYPIAAYWDGTNHVLVAVIQYFERTSIQGGTLPEAI